MMKTPKAASAKKTTTPKVKSPKTPLETSYSGIAAMMASPKAQAVSSKKGSPKTIVASPVVKKLDNTMADLRKAVAIRAILGKGATPKMPQVAPKSWADVVKKGKAKKVLTPQARRVVHVKRLGKSSKKNQRKSITKTPRTIARATAPTTGHADSPMTIVIGKKRVKTPAALPKKGRKSLGKSKAMKNNAVSPSGVKDLFKTPKAKSPKGVSPKARSPAVATPMSAGTPHSLFSDIPDTPNGPGEMAVSPLNNSIAAASPRLSGMKRLFAQPKGAKSPASHLE